MAVAAGDDVAVAGEDVGFDELQLAFVAHRRIGDDEQGVAEGFQLGPAVLFQGVLDGQFVQVELPLQVGQLLGVGLFQADPHEVPGLACPLAAFVDADVGDLSAGAVHRRCHDSTHGCSLIPVGHDVQLGLYLAQEQPARLELLLASSRACSFPQDYHSFRHCG